MSSLRLTAGLLALALLAPPAFAQGARLAPAEHAPGGIHILTMMPDGSVSCDVASEAQAEQMRQADATSTVRLTPLRSLNGPGISPFTITIRATDQLLARPIALLAFRRAAARWERIIQSPVTTVIDLDYGPNRFGGTPFPTNVIGSTNVATQFASATAGVAEAKAAILANTTDPGNVALVNAIPVPTPSSLNVNFGRIAAAYINLQALGFRPAIANPNAPFGSVPNIGFNSAFNYDFDPNDGITAGRTDFDGLVVHEIGHALGFTTAIGAASASNPQFTLWDLYRVRPGTVAIGEPYTDGVGWEVTPRLLTPGPSPSGGDQIMFTGTHIYELSTATGGRTGGDGQQGSHWRADEQGGPGGYIGIMDPTLAAGDREVITAADIQAVDLFGFAVDPTPSTAVASLTIGGQAINIDFLASTYRGALPTTGGTLPVVLANTGTGTTLRYSFETAVDSVQSTTGAMPTVTVAPTSGTVAPGAQASATLTVQGAAGGAVIYGRLIVRTNDESRSYSEVPFQISVGTPNLAPTSGPVVVSAPAGATAPATVTIQNTGDAPIRYTRVLEPAASEPGTARHAFDGEASVRSAAEATAPAEGDAARTLARLDIPATAATRLYDLAQLPTGEVVAVDGGTPATTRFFLAPADLSALTGTFTTTTSLGGEATGLAYNERTASLWVAIQQTGRVHEITLQGTSATATGRTFDTGIAPFGMAYSPELDAFLMTAFESANLYAFDVLGRLLPGYPSVIEDRALLGTPTPGVSFTEGVLDVTTTAGRYAQFGQFGKTYTGAGFQIVPSSFGIQRSRIDPNGVVYLTAPVRGSTASITTFDPPDLPANVGTRIEAAAPLFTTTLVAPGATRDLALIVDARGLAEGASVTDELAFLTNAPTNRIVRFPITINVMPVGAEDGPLALDAVATWPNPARDEATVQLTLSAATAVTVGVYNTLGQRVAVLAEGTPLGAGSHTLALRTASLAAGVYVVRVEAGASQSTHKLTVVR